MSHNLEATRARMLAAIGTVANLAVYRAGRARRMALRPYHGPMGVLQALSRSCREQYPLRDALTRALLVEHRQHDCALWSQMLTVAYYPMLRKLRFRASVEPLFADDIDQQVLMGFMQALDAVGAHPKRGHVALQLRQRTERAVFEALRRLQSPEVRLEDEELELHEPVDEHASPLQACQDQAATDALLSQLEHFCLDPNPVRDLVLATVVEDEPLHRYVERVVTGGVEHRRRVYERLKRQRSRLFSFLRQFPRPLSS